MVRTVMFNNRKGVTLIEMLISLVILLIVSLALMRSALVGISTNMQNSLRDEAVNVAETRMNQLQGLPFTDPDLAANAPAGAIDPGISRTLRNFTITYTPTRTITNINAKTKQIAVTVAWTYKGKPYTHGIVSIVRTP